MTVEEAEKVLRKEYEKAQGNPAIYNPIAYALYKTWRYADARGKKNNDK